VLGELRLVDLRPEQVCAWRASLPEGSRVAAPQALRQVLNRAVAWELIDFNPAKRGVDNPKPRSQEKHPFESWAEIEAVAAQLGPVYGPMVVFAAATGLRPVELFALEQRDVDLAAGVVYVRRAFAYGRLKKTKTRRSLRAVPLQAIALEALDRLQRSANPLLFPAPRGGYTDLRNFRAAQVEASADHRRDRAAPPAPRPAPHLRDLRAPRRRLDLRPVPRPSHLPLVADSCDRSAP
jgi:integrase